jgi:hypothetical protein
MILLKKVNNCKSTVSILIGVPGTDGRAYGEKRASMTDSEDTTSARVSHKVGESVGSQHWQHLSQWIGGLILGALMRSAWMTSDGAIRIRC